MRRIKHFPIILNILVVICTFLAYTSAFVHPSNNSFIAVMGLLFPILFLINVAFILGWLALKKYYALLSLAILALGWNPIKGLVKVGGIPAVDDKSEIFTIGTFNAHQLFNIAASRRPTSDQMEELSELVLHPDILCIEEGGIAHRFREAMGYKFKRRIPSSNSMLFSNYPILAAEQLDLAPHKSLSGWFDIDMGRDTFRLFLLHLTSNRITADSERLMEQGDIRDSETWGELRDLIGRYARAASARADQAKVIRAYIDNSPYPVIVCGDFNDVPTSYTLAKIKGDLNDSFVCAGNGFGTTYAGKVPGLRIDYVLADSKFRIISHEVPKLNVSDHNPVIVGIQITDL